MHFQVYNLGLDFSTSSPISLCLTSTSNKRARELHVIVLIRLQDDSCGRIRVANVTSTFPRFSSQICDHYCMIHDLAIDGT